MKIQDHDSDIEASLIKKVVGSGGLFTDYAYELVQRPNHFLLLFYYGNSRMPDGSITILDDNQFHAWEPFLRFMRKVES